MNKTLFGILAILCNAIGVPCFIQGQTKTGIIRIVLSMIPVVGWVICIINEIYGIILGIEVLKMTEEEFQSKLGTLDKGIPAMNK
jgi:hypothetical protein